MTEISGILMLKAGLLA